MLRLRKCDFADMIARGECKKGELLHGQFTFVSAIFKYFHKRYAVSSQEYNELCAKMLLGGKETVFFHHSTTCSRRSPPHSRNSSKASQHLPKPHRILCIVKTIAMI